jgi:hypothetical protein
MLALSKTYLLYGQLSAREQLILCNIWNDFFTEENSLFK